MILDEIVRHKREEVAESRRRHPLDEVRARAGDAPPPRDFRSALAARPDVALIAEIKRSSPSAGLIRKDFETATIAGAYAEGGAAAISVLTDERFFGGGLRHIAQVKAAAPIPVLRKDFVIDEYQVYEARAAEADAILLIVRILSDEEIAAHLALTHELGMAALVETHNRGELERAVRSDASVIGINNRDLDALTIDLAATEALVRDVPPPRLAVSESGISSRQDIERLAQCGVHAVLVGEALMKSDDIPAAVRELTRVPRMTR